MLEFESASGHVFYLNHLISCIITFFGGWIFFHFMKKKKHDKAAHLAISAIITFLLFNLFWLIKIWMWWSPITVLLIGIGKEVIDRINKKKRLFDLKDILADIAGIIPVSLIYLFSFVLYE